MKEGGFFFFSPGPDIERCPNFFSGGPDSSSGQVAERRANPGAALDHFGRDRAYALLSFALHHGQTTVSLSSRFAEIAGNAVCFFSPTLLLDVNKPI